MNVLQDYEAGELGTCGCCGKNFPYEHLDPVLLRHEGVSEDLYCEGCFDSVKVDSGDSFSRLCDSPPVVACPVCSMEHHKEPAWKVSEAPVYVCHCRKCAIFLDGGSWDARDATRDELRRSYEVMTFLQGAF